MRAVSWLGAVSASALVSQIVVGVAFAQTLPAVADQPPALAEPAQNEDIIVTGSLIAGTAKNTALPVDVVDARTLEKRGNPTVLDVLKTIPAMGAVAGDVGSGTLSTYQQGSANVNLRGLNPNRTLVLLNGHRVVGTASGAVDINLLPEAAIGRVEVLKQGAAATYGSDAIAGVVNFITRKDVRGLELQADHAFINGSKGDWKLGAIGGLNLGGLKLTASAGWQKRSSVNYTERDWATPDYLTNPQGGYTSSGNPGAFRRVGSSGTAIGPVTIDPGCSTLGGTALSSSTCFTEYRGFTNIIEDIRRFQAFGSAEYEVSSALNFHAELLYADSNAQNDSSPSYAALNTPSGVALTPGTVAVPSRFVIPCGNPGLQAMFTSNPAFASAVGGTGCVNAVGAPANSYVAAINWRPFGLGGTPVTGFEKPYTQDRQAWRYSAGVNGDISGIRYDFAATYSLNKAQIKVDDEIINRVQRSLNGFGGPNCSGTVAGVNGCLWLNPFSNAVQANAVTGALNPQYSASTVNTKELADWMNGSWTNDLRNSLFVVEGVASGKIGFLSLPGGDIAWAVGAQYRDLRYRSDYGQLNDLRHSPCVDSLDNSNATCLATQGVFLLAAPNLPVSVKQNVKAVFAELQVPIFDSLNVQIAGRYEDYGGGTGSTTNPKVAFKWQALPWFAVRGSYGSTFRGPTAQNVSPSTITVFQVLTASGQQEPVDQFGNSNLRPETANSGNIGFIVEAGPVSLSLDYYRFDFKNSIVASPADPIVSSVIPTAGGFANCAAALRSRIVFDGGNVCSQGVTTGNDINRVLASVINGPGIEVDGIDGDASLTLPVGSGNWSASINGSYLLRYDVGDTVLEGITLLRGYSAAGYLNADRIGDSLPHFKAYARSDYSIGDHTVGLALRYISEYRDNRTALFTTASPQGQSIAANGTIDLNYVLRMEKFTLTATIDNLFDHDPSFARTAQSYDPYVGNPIGRAIRFGLRARL